MIKFTMFILIFTISCASKKTATVAILAAKPNACPSDGKCTIQLFENKSLEINTVNSKIRYTLLDNDQKTVVKYEFSRNLEKSVVDGGYREEIIFEIDNQTNQYSLVDNQLQNTKMLYGRYCFCRGQTGLYIIKNGTLNLTNNDKLNFVLNFKINEVPQIINAIVVTDNKL